MVVPDQQHIHGLGKGKNNIKKHCLIYLIAASLLEINQTDKVMTGDLKTLT